MKNRKFLYAVSLLMENSKDGELQMNLINGIGQKEYIFVQTLECIKNINSNKFKDCIKMLNSNFVVLSNGIETDRFQINLNSDVLSSTREDVFVKNFISEFEKLDIQ